MFKLLLVPVVFLAVCLSLQVGLCKNAHPKRAWTKCIRPNWDKP